MAIPTPRTKHYVRTHFPDIEGVMFIPRETGTRRGLRGVLRNYERGHGMPMDNLNNDDNIMKIMCKKLYCPDGARLETTGTPSRLIKKYWKPIAIQISQNGGYCGHLGYILSYRIWGTRENLEKVGFQKCSPTPAALEHYLGRC